MSSIFTPTPVQQVNYTQPSDGDRKPVASIQAFLQGLADGAAATATLPFNWQKSSATSNLLKRGAWQAADQAWWGVGDGGNDFLEVSRDGGRTWVNKAAALGTLLPCIDIAFASSGLPAGGGVVITGGVNKDVYVGGYGGYGVLTWTHYANALSAQVASGGSLLARDDVHNYYIAAYRAAGGLHIDTSNGGGITWVAAIIPAAWSTYAGTMNPAVESNALGNSIAWFFDGTVFRILRSSTATTWTETTVTPAIATASLAATGIFTRPVYDPVLGLWYLGASTTTGTRQSEIWKSADNGATWAKTAGPTANDMVVQDLAVIAGVLIAANDDGRIFFSLDAGVTWDIATDNPIASPARPGLRAANGQAVVFNPADKTTFSTHRYGARGPSSAVVSPGGVITTTIMLGWTPHAMGAAPLVLTDSEHVIVNATTANGQQLTLMKPAFVGQTVRLNIQDASLTSGNITVAADATSTIQIGAAAGVASVTVSKTAGANVVQANDGAVVTFQAISLTQWKVIQ